MASYWLNFSNSPREINYRTDDTFQEWVFSPIDDSLIWGGPVYFPITVDYNDDYHPDLDISEMYIFQGSIYGDFEWTQYEPVDIYEVYTTVPNWFVPYTYIEYAHMAFVDQAYVHQDAIGFNLIADQWTDPELPADFFPTMVTFENTEPMRYERWDGPTHFTTMTELDAALLEANANHLDWYGQYLEDFLSTPSEEVTIHIQQWHDQTHELQYDLEITTTDSPNGDLSDLFYVTSGGEVVQIRADDNEFYSHDSIYVELTDAADNIEGRWANYADINIAAGAGDDRVELFSLEDTNYIRYFPELLLLKLQEGNDWAFINTGISVFSTEVYGGVGDDYLETTGGNDALLGGDGHDTLIGGDGEDSLFGGDSEDDLRDVVYGGGGSDYADGGYGNDELRGDAGNDTLIGGFGSDTIIGGADDDVLTAQALSDLLYGGDGDDFINGGYGYDRVNGGAGADRFYHLGVGGHGSDWIQDYNAAEGDVLEFGGSGAPGQFQVNFTETANAGAAGVAEAFVIYRPTGQILWALVDGAAQSSINIVLGAAEYDLLV